MRNFPSVEKVTLREYYPVPQEIREATVPRGALEHIESELSVLVELLDRGLAEGLRSPLWAPSPGVHCALCRRPQSCPIEAEARVAQGGITSARQAERVAAEVAVIDAYRKEAMPALKAWHEQSGLPIPVRNAKGRHEWRWTKESGGRRRFKLVAHSKIEKENDPELARAFAEAAERRAA
jgi:hypothetical protein